jgi:hypothetical protein
MDSLTENAIGNFLGGVGAAFFAALATIATNGMRAATIAEALKKSLESTSTTFDRDGFGITLTNRTSIYIIVREVRFHSRGIISTTLNPHKPTNYRGWDHDAQPDDTPEFLRFSAAIDSTDQTRGFRVLPAYTSASWLIPAWAMHNGPIDFTTLEILVEYPTLWGGRRLMTISIPPSDRLIPLHESAKQYVIWHTNLQNSRPPNPGTPPTSQTPPTK